MYNIILKQENINSFIKVKDIEYNPDEMPPLPAFGSTEAHSLQADLPEQPVVSDVRILFVFLGIIIVVLLILIYTKLKNQQVSNNLRTSEILSTPKRVLKENRNNNPVLQNEERVSVQEKTVESVSVTAEKPQEEILLDTPKTITECIKDFLERTINN